MKRNPFATADITLASETAQLTAANLNYDYTQLPDLHRMHVQSAAAQIKLNFKRLQNNILEVGKHLDAVKTRLDHGQWGEWLKAEFDLTDRSAQRYMQAWHTYGERPESAALLTSSALMLLSSDTVPEPAREEVETKAKETGKSPTKREVQEIVEKHKPVQTISEYETFKALREKLAQFSNASARQWLSEYDTADKAAFILPAYKRFDNQVYRRVRSEIMRELQPTWANDPQPTQKPAERTSTPPPTNTPARLPVPEISQPAPATQGDRLLLDGLVMQYEDSLRLLPRAKLLITDPSFQWAYDRLTKDLRTIVSHLKKL